MGNRISKNIVGIINTTYRYDFNDRLIFSALPQTYYTYDDNGNQVRTRKYENSIWTTTDYTYDYENRLTGVSSPAGTIAYEYDENGIRTAKTVDGHRTGYLVDKNRPYAQVLEEYDDTGILQASYVYGDDLISQARGAVSYYLYDGQLSTRQLTDDTGTVTDTYIYDAFGSLTFQSGTTENNYLYTGEQYDPNIGFYYLRARYLDQEAGRFITADPWHGSDFEPFTLHKYLYANANPVTCFDPSGNMTLMETSFVQSISSTLRNANLQVTSALSLIGQAFSRSGTAGGQALYNLGIQVEQSAANILSTMGAQVNRFGVMVNGPGGRRFIDLVVQIGNRIAWIEVKYQLPSKGGKALSRLVAQMQSGIASAGANAQIVIFTYKKPSLQALELVSKSIGETAHPIQYINGFRGLIQWFYLYFN